MIPLSFHVDWPWRTNTTDFLLTMDLLSLSSSLREAQEKRGVALLFFLPFDVAPLFNNHLLLGDIIIFVVDFSDDTTVEEEDKEEEKKEIIVVVVLLFFLLLLLISLSFSSALNDDVIIIHMDIHKGAKTKNMERFL